MKIQTAFRLEEELLKDLKKLAKADNRSLNNYVEYHLSNLRKSQKQASS